MPSVFCVYSLIQELITIISVYIIYKEKIWLRILDIDFRIDFSHCCMLGVIHKI